MKKVIGFLFLIIITFGFMIGVANAQRFWVRFIDSNGDGHIDFKIDIYNYSSTTYKLGIARPDTYNPIPPLLPVAPGSNSTPVSWSVTSGGSLTYDICLTDGSNYYWTSQGSADGSVTPSGNYLSINWFSSNIPVLSVSYNSTSPGDTFEIVPVPLPPALWLLGSGVIALGLVRKKLLSC